jgi:hypothetical protein
MAKRSDTAEMVARLPLDVKRWLEQEAARNGARQNSEIIRALRIRMDSENRRAAALAVLAEASAG